jgi:RimJ/RimL family protein N-acetyltransferase
MTKPEFHIVLIAEEHIAGFHAAVDSVARQRRYLAMLEAPPLEESAEFVRNNIQKGHPQFVALAGGQVVAWCDITPERRETMVHGGVLGIGVLESHRGYGIGPALLRATLEQAKKVGFKRVELTVREDNLRAKSLYELAGFVTEGIKRKAALFDGKYYDLILMSVLL